MTKVSLRKYDHEIESLIEQGLHLDEAISHCRHILLSFPKHLETYRVLGKAYLEARRYNEAVDVFQRALMAVPGDFVAHVGMSILADEHGRLAEAIWHMERAFEVQPSNAAIQGELKRLFGRRDGVEPPKIRLTRGALAHMYVQGNLFSQAIAEIRAVLNSDPTRSDLQILMAQAYFRNGQKPEATQVCTELLTHYPDCLDANCLMVEMLLGTQDTASVPDYQQRIYDLDPYAAFAQGSVFDSGKVPDDAVTLEKLEFKEQAQVRDVVLGIGLASDAYQFGRIAEQPDRLPETPSSRITDMPVLSPEEDVDSQDKEASPEILQPGAVDGTDEPTNSTGDKSTSALSASDFSASEFSASGSESEPPAVEGKIPDWTNTLAPAEDRMSATQPTAPISNSPSQSADTPDWLRNSGGDQSPGQTPSEADLIEGDTPTWIKTLGSSDLDQSTPPSKAESDVTWLNSLKSDQQTVADVPSSAGEGLESSQPGSLDWLKDFDNGLEKPIDKTDAAPVESTPQAVPLEPSGNLSSLELTGQDQDDTTGWMKGLAPKEGAGEEELLMDRNLTPNNSRGQLKDAEEIVELIPESSPTHLGPVDDKTGTRPANIQVSEPEAVFVNNDLPEPLDSQGGFSGSKDSAVIATDGEKEDSPSMSETDSPDWLRSSGLTPSIGEEVPDWIHAQSAGSNQVESNVQPTSEPVSESVKDLPPWLAGLEKDEAGSVGASAASGDMPPWLQSEVEPEPQSMKRTLAADWKPLHTSTESKSKQAPSYENVQTHEVSTPAIPVSQPGVSSPSSDNSSMAAFDLPPETSNAPDGIEHPEPASSIPLEAAALTGSVVADDSSLGGAQSELGRGNIPEALVIYERLIRKGKSLEEIINDLRDAQYRYPVDVSILQVLGDAYMRTNRLQEALDSYTKAEELLR